MGDWNSEIVLSWEAMPSAHLVDSSSSVKMKEESRTICRRNRSYLLAELARLDVGLSMRT